MKVNVKWVFVTNYTLQLSCQFKAVCQQSTCIECWQTNVNYVMSLSSGMFTLYCHIDLGVAPPRFHLMAAENQIYLGVAWE